MEEDDLNDDRFLAKVREQASFEPLVSIPYYELYAAKEHASGGDSVNEDGMLQHRSLPKNSEDDDSDDPEGHPASLPLWEPDVWTASDEERAEELLQKHWSKCRIPNNNQRNPSEIQKNRLARRADATRDNTNNNIDNADDESGDENSKQRNDNDTSDGHVWDAFYRQHQTNFFKDRKYLSKSAFPQELASSEQQEDDDGGVVLVEIGCGVGNALWPILEQSYPSFEAESTTTHPDESQTPQQRRHRPWTVYGLDWSTVAIDTLRRDPRFVRAANEHRAYAAVCDVSQMDSIPMAFRNVGTVTSMVFCLSAISPDRHVNAVRNAIHTLRPGGVLIFRDYGRYDQAQLSLGQQRHKWISEHFYRKHDGTKCYYFTVPEIRRLFVNECHLEELDCDYIRRVYYNRKQNTQRRRVWIQARFRKPMTDEHGS
jgi:methyltransferase-like protein 6